MEVLKKRGIVESLEGSYTYLRKIPSRDAHATGPGAHAAKTGISLWVSGRQELRKLRQAIARRRFADQFCRTHPDVEIRERIIGGEYHDFDALLLQSLLSESEPTAGRMQRTYLSFLLSNAALAPIAEDLADGYLQRLNPRYRQACSRDGKLHLLPTNVTHSLLFYNKALFYKAGLDPAQPPRDWEEFALACKKLSDSNGGLPAFHLAGAEGFIWWLMQLTYQCLPRTDSDVLPAVDWNSAAAREAAEFGVGLYSRQKAVAVHTEDVPALASQCLADEIPMLMGETVAAQIAGLGAADRFGIAPLPTGPNGKIISMLNCGGWFVNALATQAQQEAACRYMFAWERWLHEEAGGAHMRRLGVWPSLTSVLRDPAEDEYVARKLPSDWPPVLEELVANSYWEPAEADWKKQVHGKAFEALLKSPKLTAELVLQRLRQQEQEGGFLEDASALPLFAEAGSEGTAFRPSKESIDETIG